MGFEVYSKNQMDRIDHVVEWAEGMMGAPPTEKPRRNDIRASQPLRGFLAQNVSQGRWGLMYIAKRLTIYNATQVSIVGTNYIEQSQFKLQLIGTDSKGKQTTLCTSQPINVTDSNAAIQTNLTLAAQGQTLAVGRNDIVVTGGNPITEPDLVFDPTISQTELVPAGINPPTLPKSYMGTWVIQVNGSLNIQYVILQYVIIIDNTAFMRGLSGVVATPILDVPTPEPQQVFDSLNRPPDYPWTAGSLVVCLPFTGIGYGIINSMWRDETISIPPPTAEPQQQSS